MQQRALRAQEWVRKMEELGIGVNIPALHEVVLGGARADPWERDLTKFNERTWNDLMVCRLYGSASERRLNDPWCGACLPAPVGDS